MRLRRDPFAEPERLARRIYSYAAYRIGDGPDAEDVASEAIERAFRYREKYDPAKGDPMSWVIGIARRCVDDALRTRPLVVEPPAEIADPADLASEAADRMTLEAALGRLSDRDRELVSMRYGADLTARQIGELLGERTNTVEVWLHRALRRLRAELEPGQSPPGRPRFSRPAERL